eukprot:15481679-Alexandrium_andersonii.AAC.1
MQTSPGHAQLLAELPRTARFSAAPPATPPVGGPIGETGHAPDRPTGCAPGDAEEERAKRGEPAAHPPSDAENEPTRGFWECAPGVAESELAEA